jgi:hypothetical protein
MPDLKINLPFSRWDYHLVGVYRIQFETGEFYIGSSVHIHSRARNWAAVFEKPFKEHSAYTIGGDLLQRIRNGGDAVLELLELCSAEDLREREAEYLFKFKDDPLMLSKPDCSWKSVIQYKSDGHFIKRHVSIKSAAAYNGFRMSKVQMVLNRERPSYKGMVFVFENDYQDRRKGIIRGRYERLNLPKKTKNLKIEQCDSDGHVLNTYNTYADAARSVNCSTRNIKRALARKQRTAAGFTWKYADQPEPSGITG